VKKTVCLVIISLLISLFCGCSSPTPTKGPIESLSRNDALVYKAVLTVLQGNIFSYPETARIISIYENRDIEYALKITIRGNSNGDDGKVMMFNFYYQDGSINDNDRISYTIPWSDTRVGAIDSALIQHWNDLGMVP